MSAKEQDNGAVAWIVGGLVAAGVIAGAILLYISQPSGSSSAGPTPGGPAPTVEFISPPVISGSWIDTPVVNTGSSSVTVDVSAALTRSNGTAFSSSTGPFTMAAGEKRTYTAIDIAAYAGSGAGTGVVVISVNGVAVGGSAEVSGTI